MTISFSELHFSLECHNRQAIHGFCHIPKFLGIWIRRIFLFYFINVSTVVVTQNFTDWKPSPYSSILPFQGKSDEQLYLKDVLTSGLLHIEMWLFVYSSVLFNQNHRDLKCLSLFCTMYIINSLCISTLTTETTLFMLYIPVLYASLINSEQ